MAVEGFASPGGAALASWQGTPAVNARVRSVTVRGARAEVVVETDQSNGGYLDYVYCIQGEAGRWREVVSGNGPTVRWDDPDEYTWSYSGLPARPADLPGWWRIGRLLRRPFDDALHGHVRDPARLGDLSQG